MAVLNEGLQFRLLAGDLKNTGTILESVMRVRQYWDCLLVFGQVFPVCDQEEARAVVLALATWCRPSGHFRTGRLDD